MKNQLLKIAFAITLLFFNSAQANISGTHLQNFNPTSDGLCFVTVHCTQTLEPGYANLGVFANYAVNSLPFFRNPTVISTQKLSEPNDKLLSTDFSIGLGIMDGWDIGVSFPFIVDQDVDNSVQLGTYEETGLTEWKINTKYRIARTTDWGMALVASANFDRIGNNPFSGIDSGATINGEFVFDYNVSPEILWGFNVGYRMRDDGTPIAGTGVLPIGDQYTYSTGASYLYRSWETVFIGELYGSLPTDSVDLPTDRKGSNLEILLGAKKTFAERWDVHGGITREIYHGLATPDFRLYMGLNLRIGPLVSKAATPAPEPEAPPVVKETFPEEPPDEVIVLHSINFDTNLTTMKKASQIKFGETVAQLQKKVPDLRRIVVEGHTDNVGTDAHNLKLSQGRAESVRAEILKGLSLSDEQVKAVGHGESRPIANNGTESGRAKNRRVELKIYRNK